MVKNKGGLINLTKGRSAPRAKRVARGGKKINTWLATSHQEIYVDDRPLWGEELENWRPSNMNEGFCDRTSVLKVLGYRGEPTGYNLNRIFEMGRRIEEMWRDDFRKQGVLCDAGGADLKANRQVEKNYPPLVKGEFDMRIRHAYQSTQIFVVDIKSIADALWKMLPPTTMDAKANSNNLLTIGLPMLRSRMRGYVIQLNMYMDMLDMEDAILIMDNKDCQKFKDYYLVRNQNIVDSAVYARQRLDPYREGRIIPACTCFPEKRKGVCAYHPEDEIPLDDLKEEFNDNDRESGREVELEDDFGGSQGED